MIFDFLKKRKKKHEKIYLIKIMIKSIKLSEEQKELYLEALEVINDSNLDNLYNDITYFIKNYEIKSIENISKQNFSKIEGLRKKEAKEKQEELNAFTFLLNNT